MTRQRNTIRRKNILSHPDTIRYGEVEGGLSLNLNVLGKLLLPVRGGSFESKLPHWYVSVINPFIVSDAKLRLTFFEDNLSREGYL